MYETAQPIEQTLDAREFINALHVIETQGLPPGTRSYLISINHEDRRTLTAVSSSASVLDLERDLISHFESWMTPSDEYLLKVRDYLNDRLKRAKAETRGPKEIKLERIVRESAWEQHEIGQALVKAGRESNNESLLTRCMTLRVVELASIVMGAVGEDADDPDELAERLFGPPEPSEE